MLRLLDLQLKDTNICTGWSIPCAWKRTALTVWCNSTWHDSF